MVVMTAESRVEHWAVWTVLQKAERWGKKSVGYLVARLVAYSAALTAEKLVVAMVAT